MNPSVGLTVLTSSPIILLTMVVFPALSKPLHTIYVRRNAQNKLGREDGWVVTHSIKMRSSLSLSRAFRSIDSIMPCSSVFSWALHVCR